MAHNISAQKLQLLDMLGGTDATIEPFETRVRKGDFMLTARNERNETTIEVQFSEADAYALQDWLNARFPKNAD